MALNRKFDDELKAGIEQLKKDKVYKRLNYLDSPQSARVRMEGRGEVLILSSNNYLGLCAEPEVVQAGLDGLEKFGAGTGSVRFICGTFTVHRELENRRAIKLRDEYVERGVLPLYLVALQFQRFADAAAKPWLDGDDDFVFDRPAFQLSSKCLIDFVGHLAVLGRFSASRKD